MDVKLVLLVEGFHAVTVPGFISQRPTIPRAAEPRCSESNSSVVFDETLILKVFRRLEPGINPELEVLRLIAQGETNRGAAGHLFISEATVKTHVSHLLGKLGLRDRVQAVVFAYEHGLVERA
jgi:ATP/maltotriose-dependent transcriptional regulator MalT